MQPLVLDEQVAGKRLLDGLRARGIEVSSVGDFGVTSSVSSFGATSSSADTSDPSTSTIWSSVCWEVSGRRRGEKRIREDSSSCSDEPEARDGAGDTRGRAPGVACGANARRALATVAAPRPRYRDRLGDTRNAHFDHQDDHAAAPTRLPLERTLSRMEFNLTVNIAGSGRANDFAERLLGGLEHDFARFGPVLSAEDPDASPVSVLLTIEAGTVAEAVGKATGAIEQVVSTLGIDPRAACALAVEATPATKPSAAA